MREQVHEQAGDDGRDADGVAREETRGRNGSSAASQRLHPPHEEPVERDAGDRQPQGKAGAPRFVPGAPLVERSGDRLAGRAVACRGVRPAACCAGLTVARRVGERRILCRIRPHGAFGPAAREGEQEGRRRRGDEGDRRSGPVDEGKRRRDVDDGVEQQRHAQHEQRLPPAQRGEGLRPQREQGGRRRREGKSADLSDRRGHEPRGRKVEQREGDDRAGCQRDGPGRRHAPGRFGTRGRHR